MESSPINSHSHSSNYSPTFLSPDRRSSPDFQISDHIEMTPLQSYTSLKDLLPDTPPPPPSSASPFSSWNEIPIKNPLVKHAALAYLQPMLAPPVTGDRGFMRNGFGCIEWLGAVVLAAVREISGGVRRWD